MWNLQTPLIELILRSVTVFFVLFIAMRLWGKKHFSELSPFDFILLLIISEATQNSLVGDEKSIPGGVIVIFTLFLLNVTLNKISFHSKKAEKLLEGDPKPLIVDGKLDKEMMKREKLTLQEVNALFKKARPDEDGGNRPCCD